MNSYFGRVKYRFFQKIAVAGFLAMAVSMLPACKKRCYECRLMQINGPTHPVYPNDTIAIDTVQTCNGRWVKENNVPADEIYPQSWRCKEQ